MWRAGPVKPNGKFDKIPCSPSTGKNINGQDSENWLNFDDALAAHRNGTGDGIGIVLSIDHPIPYNGVDHYLVALDFDNCKSRMSQLQQLWLNLGKPYTELSPSDKGLRMFALSRQPFKGGNDGNGHELYSGGRFMTVTGRSAMGQINDATDVLEDLHQQWFGPKNPPKLPGMPQLPEELLKLLKENSTTRPLPPAQTDEEVSLVRDALSFVSSDTEYETWRDFVWSILWTEWSCAEDMARQWSMTAPHRYNAAAF
jgi:primase-polymerase (primpol)-like protein